MEAFTPTAVLTEEIFIKDEEADQTILKEEPLEDYLFEERQLMEELPEVRQVKEELPEERQVKEELPEDSTLENAEVLAKDTAEDDILERSNLPDPLEPTLHKQILCSQAKLMVINVFKYFQKYKLIRAKTTVCAELVGRALAGDRGEGVKEWGLPSDRDAHEIIDSDDLSRDIALNKIENRCIMPREDMNVNKTVAEAAGVSEAVVKRLIRAYRTEGIEKAIRPPYTRKKQKNNSDVIVGVGGVAKPSNSKKATQSKAKKTIN